ncbi:MAG: hypothetical protein CM15mV22_1300 [Eurybiavirus sp.]|nr:MAG: hypothetical protein CM15mV22_1300 [Eurybiavirus sp.]
MFLKQTIAKTGQGSGNYYPQIILDQSNYIYWGSHETAVYDVSANQSATGGNIAGSNNVGSPHRNIRFIWSTYRVHLRQRC